MRIFIIFSAYSTTQEVSMSFIEPSNGQRYSASYDKKTQINVPLRISSDIDVRNREIKTEVKPMTTDKEMKIVQLETSPFTARDNVFNIRPMSESKHAKKIENDSARQWTAEYGKKQTGFAFKVNSKEGKGSNQIAKMIKQLRERDLTSIIMFGEQDTSIEQSSLTVSYNGPQSTSKSAKLTVKYVRENANNQNNKNSDRSRSHPRSLGKSADGKTNLAKPDSTEPNSQERREQFLRNAAEGMK